MDRRLLEIRIGLALVTGLGLLVFGLLLLGSLTPNPALTPIPVGEVLSAPDRVAAYGIGDLRIVGWYAELRADCSGDNGGADPAVAWLQAECPLRVLLPSQPGEDITQAGLERAGLRLSATSGRPFPPRAEPGGANLQLEELVFVGHFADATAANCVPERAARCYTTFVVTDYTRYVR